MIAITAFLTVSVVVSLIAGRVLGAHSNNDDMLARVRKAGF